MFDFFSEIGKSADDKRHEALNAYLDGALSPREQEVLEGDLQRDATLRAELAQLRLVRQELRGLPRRRVPRSFSLDPALYGPPKAQPAQQLYPLLRGATALTALLFVFVLGLSLLNGIVGPDQATIEAVTMAEEAAPAIPPATGANAELALEAPLAAEAGIAIEEATEAGTETGAMTEAPKDDAEDAPPVAPEASRAVPDITDRLEPSGTVAALATAEIAGATAADETVQPFAAEAAPPSPSWPLGTIAAVLGLMSVIFGVLTLWLRSRQSV
jgi:anti-sigma factor RsiW